jgi:hypothetical protein
VRIDDITIEDVSSYFLADSLGYVDVRDYGAVGDGTTDCKTAFEAADDAANGKRVFVPEGEYFIGSSLSMLNEMQFEGTLTMDDDVRFILRRNFHLNSYIDAFGDELLAFKKAFQAMLNYADHDHLDLCGRRIEVTEPIDLQAAVENKTVYEVRRIIRNGQFNAETSTDWDTDVATSTATYSSSNSDELTNVSNIANIQPGSLVTGNGVGREVYVTSVNVGAQTLELSQPLFDPNSNQTYTFERFKYILDFSGFEKLTQFSIDDVEFLCNSNASAVLMAPDGSIFQLRDCHVKSPADRGITSHGEGCQDFSLDRCFFNSKESSSAAVDRTTIAFNVNANDAKIRDNRFVHFLHTGIISGSGNLFTGNHWFQGDNETESPRTAGLVFTNTNVKSILTGNYIDNSFIEMANEHDANPEFSNEFSFGGLTLTGNIFTANDAASWFSWLVITPHGEDHFVQGLSVQGNTFKTLNNNLNRIEKVDNTYADLDHSRMRNVVFAGNTFNGMDQNTINPVSLDFTQSSTASNWTLDPSAYLPFGGHTRTVEALIFDGELTNTSGNTASAMPYVTTTYGTNSNQVRLSFPEATKGTVQLTVRADKPI